MKRTPQTREEAILLNEKRTAMIETGSEDILQAEIFKSFTNRYPEQRGRLFSTFQNPQGVRQFGIWTARGLVEGVSDLLYTDDYFRLVGIEIKHPEKYHSVERVKRQAEWIIKCAYRGGFCTSLEMFWTIINGGNGIDPKKVISHLENNSKKTTIQFKNLIHL